MTQTTPKTMPWVTQAYLPGTKNGSMKFRFVGLWEPRFAAVYKLRPSNQPLKSQETVNNNPGNMHLLADSVVTSQHKQAVTGRVGSLPKAGSDGKHLDPRQEAYKAEKIRSPNSLETATSSIF